MANIDEMFADLAAADAAGDKELATVIASRIRQAESAAAQAAPAPIPEAAPQSRLQSFLSAASRTYTPELGITSPELAAAERQGMVKIAPEVVRYGVPIAAVIAAAPVVAPLGVAAGMASMAGIGGAASYTSELAAQKMAGEDIDQRKALAMGVAGATPFRGTGSLVARLGTNVPSAIAASEAARYIENPEAYAAPSLSAGATENLIRFLPATVAGAGTMMGKFGEAGLAKKGELAQSIREGSQVAQQEFGVTMGRAPLLQDLFGGTATPAPGGSFISNLVEPAAIERAAIQRANPVAMQAMENALIGPSEGFAALSRSAPDLFPLTEEVRNNIGVLEPIYQAAKKSRDEAIVLTQRAQDLQIKGMAGASEALDLARAARLKAYAEEVVYNSAWEKSLGREAPNLKQISLGERNARIKQAGEIASDARDAAVNEAYKKAGIGENDAIVSLADIFEKAQKKITSNDSRAEFLAAVKTAFGDDPATILDRTQFIKARNKLAAAIVKNTGVEPSAATREATQYYKTMKEAAESFIQRTDSAKLKPYKEAQKRAARFFDVEDTKAYDLLAKGDAAGFYEAAKKTGASVGGVYNQAMQFTKALREEGAGAVADGLEKSINLAIRDGLLDNVVNRGTGFQGARIVRAPELVKELQSLKESGFPISRLALGKPEDIRVLARISSTTGGAGFTTSELNGFLDNVEKIGLDKATAKLNYERAVRNAFIETEPARKLKEAQKARIEARKAGLNAQQQEAIARQKESDPLIKFLNEPGSATSMGILNDPAKNADLVETLFSLEPTMVSRFMGSLRASGRSSQAQDVEKAVIARMFGKFEKGTSKVDLINILDTFRNPSKLGTLNSLKAVLGQQRFDSLEENLVKPLDQLAKSYERADAPLPETWGQVRAAITAATLAKKRSFTGASLPVYLANSLRGGLEALQNKQYNLLYKLYIDPTTAPKFAKAGYAIDKIMQQPVLAATYKLAQDMDAQQSQPTP